MNTLNFLDANVWLALIWGRHAHSERARAWFEHSAEEQFFVLSFPTGEPEVSSQIGGLLGNMHGFTARHHLCRSSDRVGRQFRRLLI